MWHSLGSLLVALGILSVQCWTPLAPLRIHFGFRSSTSFLSAPESAGSTCRQPRTPKPKEFYLPIVPKRDLAVGTSIRNALFFHNFYNFYIFIYFTIFIIFRSLHIYILIFLYNYLIIYLFNYLINYFLFNYLFMFFWNWYLYGFL